METIERVQGLRKLFEKLSVITIIATIISFIFSFFVYHGGDYERIVWLWCCALMSGMSILSFGLMVGFYISERIFSENSK